MEAAALETLIARYEDRVRSLVGPMMRCEQEAEDVCQETWFTIWNARERIDAERSPWGFIRRVAVSRAVDRLRGRQARASGASLDREPAAAEAPSVDPRLAGALATLGAAERRCLLLHFLGGLSVAEIAARERVSPNTVKTWMRRGRLRLRACLESEQ